ncbi:unnamed protein product [Spodoptera littoralis]|uniref:Uncharacterized protein n=1 Tax=Spodoptera littoralis TaxID=7109 RepID=A0A9P0IBZ0_SPOLI|nr:unnamed protein product [Spodoptera littoralis]CAH1643915.1 unnamed protein product [Spodoptera littoralis]
MVEISCTAPSQLDALLRALRILGKRQQTTIPQKKRPPTYPLSCAINAHFLRGQHKARTQIIWSYAQCIAQTGYNFVSCLNRFLKVSILHHYALSSSEKCDECQSIYGKCDHYIHGAPIYFHATFPQALR